MISPMMRISIDNVEHYLFKGIILRTFPGLKLNLFRGSALCSPSRCSPNLCSPVPMFPGTYIPRFTANVLDVVIQSELFEKKIQVCTVWARILACA